jgi:hypothetical protein
MYKSTKVQSTKVQKYKIQNTRYKTQDTKHTQCTTLLTTADGPGPGGRPTMPMRKPAMANKARNANECKVSLFLLDLNYSPASVAESRRYEHTASCLHHKGVSVT